VTRGAAASATTISSPLAWDWVSDLTTRKVKNPITTRRTRSPAAIQYLAVRSRAEEPSVCFHITALLPTRTSRGVDRLMLARPHTA
jgi:hypothetical protein